MIALSHISGRMTAGRREGADSIWSTNDSWPLIGEIDNRCGIMHEFHLIEGPGGGTTGAMLAHAASRSSIRPDVAD